MCTKILVSIVAWGQSIFVKFRPILKVQVTSGYDKFFKTCFFDQFLCSETRGSLHYLYSLTFTSFWSCCRLNALLKVNIKNHINACKTLLLEPMLNITRRVLPAVLLEIVQFLWYDSLDCSCTIRNFSCPLRTTCGWFNILVAFFKNIRFSIRITKLTIHW